MPKFYLPVATALLGMVLTLASSVSLAEKPNATKFTEPVRIAYVPQRSFMVDNGIESGVLGPLMECSSSYFSNIEYVEMASYDMLLRSLESNVVDIGLNMVRSKSRDAVAKYGMDIYKSRILLVNDESSASNQGAGILAVRQGSDLGPLLETKGYIVNTKAYSIDRLIEMFRKDLINSFAEMELTVYDELKAMDLDGLDYDYIVLSEQVGGSYLANKFVEKHPHVINAWKKTVQSCAYLSPKLDG